MCAQDDNTADSPRNVQCIITFLLVTALTLVILYFYFWTATSTYHRPFQLIINSGQYKYDYYNLQAEAFLAGKLHLLVEPDAGLQALSDPYDPVQNNSLRLNDLSYYKGKYYLYFGASPVVTLLIPFRLLTGKKLPQDYSCAFFASLGFIFYMLTLTSLKKSSFPETGFHVYYAGIASLGLCSFIPYILRRPEVYEVAILAGYAYSAGSLYFAVSALSGSRGTMVRLAAGSLFLGLAVGARPQLVLFFPFFLLAAISCLRATYPEKELPGRMGMILSPFLFCLFLVLMYNHLRFGSPLEFGMKYQLASWNIRTMKGYQLSFVPPGMYCYFIFPYLVDGRFPYFHTKPFFYPWKLPEGYIGGFDIAGVFLTSPFILIIFLLPFLNILALKKVRQIVLGCSLLGFIIAFVNSFIVPVTTIRYAVDFLPLFVFASLVIWFQIDTLLIRKPLQRHLACVCMMALTGISLLFNIFTSFAGCYDLLQAHNPEIYRSIKLFYDAMFHIH